MTKQQSPPTKKASKYQRKLSRRRARAKQLGLNPNATWPEIWQAEAYDQMDIHSTITIL